MIDFAKGLDLPDDAVTQTIALIGRKGSGKTYTAGKLIEGMVNLGAQVIVVDPVGIYWGLRLASNGKGAGLSIPILGGERGDLPLADGAGAIVADFLIEKRRSAVLDVSLFRKAERVRFVTALAEQIFHIKKTHRSPVHIVLEETHKFIPERAVGADARMIGAWEDIVRLGRNYGLGTTMISQRPQSINKEVLNQTECLICHQVTGPHERKAIRGWVVDRDIDVGEMVEDLPSLDPGVAYFWSPAWLRILRKIRIKKKRTYDASSTPVVGADYSAETKPLASIEITSLTNSMKQIIESAEANDPKTLHKRIRDLERKLSKAPAIDENAIQSAVDAAVAAAIRARDKEWSQSIDTLSKSVHDALGDLTVPNWNGQTSKRSSSVRTRSQGGKILCIPDALRVCSEPSGNLTGPHQRIVNAIRWWNVMGVDLPTMGQIAFRAGYKPKGGSFNTYCSALSTMGYVERHQGALTLTIEGFQEAKEPDTTGGLEELHEAILNALRNGKGTGGPHANILSVILEEVNGISKEDLATRVGYSSRGGSFNTYISRLSSLGLIERQRGMITPSKILYPSGVA